MSRLAKEKSTTLQTQPIVKSETPEPVTNTRPVTREVTCFNCHQRGHKSPQCPQRQTQVKIIQIPSNKVVPLKDNELFGSVGMHRLPITCDSGADISVVPEECVSLDQFTSQMCEIDSFNKMRSVGSYAILK